MANPRYQNKVFEEKALGDNNCAFNAFALALEHMLPQIVVDHPESAFASFIEEAAREFQLANPNWSTVQNAMHQLKAQDREKYQKKLAKVLRRLSCVEATKDVEHPTRTLPSFLGAFTDTVYKKMGITTQGVKDDIYANHPLIQEAFTKVGNAIIKKAAEDKKFDVNAYNQLRAKIRNLNTAEAKKLSELEDELNRLLNFAVVPLTNWWKETGFRLFVNKMGEDQVWAGDLELFLLARYFHFNLDVKRIHFTQPHHIYFNSGTLPCNDLSEGTIKQLVLRGIVDKPVENNPNVLSLFPQEYDDVESLLQGVGQNEQETNAIAQYIANYGKEHETEDFPSEIKFAPVPNEWSIESRLQLFARNVITMDERGQAYFNKNKSDALALIKPIPEAEEILQRWLDYYKMLPLATLRNDRVHWDNLTPPVAAQPQVKVTAPAQPAMKEAAKPQAKETIPAIAKVTTKPAATPQAEVTVPVKDAVRPQDSAKASVKPVVNVPPPPPVAHKQATPPVKDAVIPHQARDPERVPVKQSPAIPAAKATAPIEAPVPPLVVKQVAPPPLPAKVTVPPQVKETTPASKPIVQEEKRLAQKRRLESDVMPVNKVKKSKISGPQTQELAPQEAIQDTSDADEQRRIENHRQLVADTISEIKRWNKHQVTNEWENLIEEEEAKEDPESFASNLFEEKISYTSVSGSSFFVTTDTQIKLDQALAKKLQLEDYEASKKKKR